MIFSVKQLSQKQVVIYLVILALTVYQLVRVIVFVNEYGGLEHDGGWLLGVSRSLVERGTFTTMVSTIVDPAVRGGITVDGKFNIQDDEGRIWFYTANSVGPIVFGVNTIFLKLFGFGFWPLHLGSLFFFAGFLILASVLLRMAQGLGAVLLFYLYLFLYPHLSIFLGYEALGEVPGMACVLLAYLVFTKTAERSSLSSVNGRAQGSLWFFLSGLTVGLAINTKLLILLSLGGIFILWLRLMWERRTTFKDGLVLATGVLTIPVLWELTHLVVLTRRFGFALYQQNLQGRINHFLNEGSGIGAQDYGGTRFYWDKALIVSEISHPNQILSLLTLALVAIGGLMLIWLYRQNRTRQNLVILLWAGWLGNIIWFIGLAKTGWMRHAWFGLVLAVMIISLILGELLHRVKRQPDWRNVAAVALVAGLVLPGFAAQRDAATFFIADHLVEMWRQKQIAAKYSKVPWMITPRVEQQRVVDFLEQLPPEGRVFYPANHKAAEIAVQVGKIFYPIDRRELMPPAKGDVILVGATLISPWKDPGIRHSIIERSKTECPNFLYQSDYYIICTQ